MLVQTAARNNTSAEINLMPIVRTLPADLETPVSVYLKLAGRGPSFLLESVTGGEQLARYSFIGIEPRHAYLIKDSGLYHQDLDTGEITVLQVKDLDPFQALRADFARYKYAFTPELPRFPGGLVGYLGYDLVRYFEPSLKLSAHVDLPEALFLLADTLVAFDHAYGRLVLVANIRMAGDEAAERKRAESRLDELERRLQDPIPDQLSSQEEEYGAEVRHETDRSRFMDAVLEAKEHIAAGNIFQVVLSQSLRIWTSAKPFSIYRNLRRLNPSPYMFYFDFSNILDGPPLRMIGASPEMHVRLEGQVASLRPIAGTRPRGKSPQEDQQFEAGLLADPKERAEHIMLVDLARNDLGRVCDYGSIHVPELMRVERYSHVMHIVSQVEGRLRPEYDAFDLIRATFPAGTVSGAPKIRAMEIIEELEGMARGPYAGAVGYFAYDGSADTCITIRSLVMRGQEVAIQAGAGIVADSDPEREYQETLNKAKALAVAVELAGRPATASRRKSLYGGEYDPGN